MPAGKPKSTWVDTVYERIANEEDARVCKAISEEACRFVPGNFFIQLAANSLTKIGDRLANPKTTLAWLLTALGAPAFFTGIIVPVRESGSLLPQLVIAGYIRQLPVRKWVWVLGAVLQGLTVLGLGMAALELTGSAAGWTFVGLLVLFSLSRGLCSVASKDILGKTIPKSRRGFLKGLMSSISGTVVILAGIALIVRSVTGDTGRDIQDYALLLFVAGLLWILAALIFGTIKEFPGATDGGGKALSEALGQLKLLRSDGPFRKFVIVRTLAIGSGLASPFLIGLAQARLGQSAVWLGIFVLVDGLAGTVASPILGRIADYSSRRLIRGAMLASCALLIVVIVFSLIPSPGWVAAGAYPAAFFMLGIIHSGVRLGRKTYLVDMAEGNQRTAYVAVSNTVIGILLLLVGVITGSLALLSIHVALGVFAICALFGAVLAGSLPEVSDS